MPAISWKNAIYPVLCEYQDTDGEWNTFLVAKDYNETQEHVLFHGVSLPTFTALRMTEGNGQVTESSTEELLELKEKSDLKISKRYMKLNKFAHSAPEQATEIALELITGGLAAQHFVIPPMARVTISHPDLSHLTIKETESFIACQIYENKEELEIPPCITFWKELRQSEISHPNMKTINNEIGVSIRPAQISNGIQGFLILLCATIIRDFWVLQQRERSEQYQTKTETTRERTGHGKQRKLVKKKNYTFIPRFKYDFDTYKINKSVQHNIRVTLSPHLVSGHIRNLPNGWNTSEQAQDNAKEFGIKLTTGTTFVRPHKRGEIEQLRTYRSKSALKMLFQK